MNASDLEQFLRCGAVIASSPGKIYVGWGKRAWGSQYGISFYFPDYFLNDDQPWFAHEKTNEMPISKLLSLLRNHPHEPLSCNWKNDEEMLFKSSFSELQDLFSKETLKKGVPYVFEKAKGSPTAENLAHLLIHALEYSQKHPVYLYGFWDEAQGILGATPEVLFELVDQELKTVACAGTCPKHEVSELKNDPKQLHEHQLVVEGIYESLKPFGRVVSGDVEVLELPNLCHLVTPITVYPESRIEVDQIVKAIHPTPALGAFPKKPGMAWLIDLQKKIPRNRFGAPVGYRLPDGKASCYVAIRNMQWSEGEMQIGAGCGVVPQSDPDMEWNEIKLKIESIKRILSL